MPAAKNASKKKNGDNKEGLAVKKTVKTKAAPKPKKEKKPKAPKPKAAPKKKVNLYNFWLKSRTIFFCFSGCSWITWISIQFYHQFQFIVVTLCLKTMNKRFVLVDSCSFIKRVIVQSVLKSLRTFWMFSFFAILQLWPTSNVALSRAPGRHEGESI